MSSCRRTFAGGRWPPASRAGRWRWRRSCCRQGGAPRVYQGLSVRRWSWPLHGATGLAAVSALVAVGRRRYRLARLLAAAQVALVVLGWGASQYPFVVVPDLTLAAASAPRATQTLLLATLGAGALVLFPSLRLLFRVFKSRPR